MINTMKIKPSRGFTLIEMIVVITVTSIVIGSAAMIFSHGSSGYFTAQQLNGLSIEAEQAVNQLSKELRMARSITATSSSQLSFVNQTGNSIIYSLNGTNLLRSQDGGSTTNLSSNHTSSFTVSYFDASLASSTTPSEVKLINVVISFADNVNTLQMIQSIYLRSLL